MIGLVGRICTDWKRKSTNNCKDAEEDTQR